MAMFMRAIIVAESVLVAAIVTFRPTLAVGDVVWLALIAASGPVSAILGALITLLINSIFAKRNTKAIEEQTAVIVKVADVNEKSQGQIADKLAASDKVYAKQMQTVVTASTDAATMLNHEKGVLLEELAISKRKTANATKNQEDEASAKHSEMVLIAHKAAQSIVDARAKAVVADTLKGPC